jgi:predicted metal-dependent phosphoesterase TrpH
MVGRLAAMGISLDFEAIVQPGIVDPTRAVGRPWLARALVAAGHVATTKEAFDRFLARGRSAFVPRAGAPPEEVVACVHEAGGLASIAHPGLVRHDEWIAEFAAAGVDALEAYHTDHTPEMQAETLAAARRLNLAVSGGSDYHGDDARRPLGGVTLPEPVFNELVARRK